MSTGAVATAYVRLRPSTAGFQQEADAELKGALTGVQKLAAAAIGVASVAEGVKLLAEAASQHQSAVALTEKTVENAGAAWKVYGGTVETALDKQARASGISFQELYQGFIRLETQIKDTPKALNALGLAEDVARARHIQLGQAATALARASAGNVQSLSRLGIVIAKVSPITDELKGKLLDIKTAQEAQTEAAAKQYKGTVNLTDSQLALSRLSPIQLKNLQAQTSAQLEAAAAQDKTVAGNQALAEVQKRFGGDSAAYAKTAAGEYDRFKVSVEEAAASLGAVLLPELSDAAKAAAGYADDLGKSKGAASAIATGAHDIGEAVQATVAIVKAAGPVFQVLQSGVDAIGGVGPILAGYAAYKTLTIGIGIAGKAVGVFAGETAAETTTTVANTVAKTEATAATVAQTTATEADTEAQLALFRAVELEGAQQQILFTEVSAATGAIEAEGAAAATAAGELETARVAAVGLSTVDLGVLGIAAGAIYYLSTRSDEGAKALKNFHTAYAQLAADKGNVAAQATDVASLAKQYGDLAEQARAAAALQAQIDGSFSEARDAARGSGEAVAIYVKGLESVKATVGSTDPILVGQITRLQNIAQLYNRLPSSKTIKLVLDDRSALDNLDLAQAKVDQLVKTAEGLSGSFGRSVNALGTAIAGVGANPPIKLLDPKGFDKAIGAVPPVEKASHQLGATAAKAFSTAFAQNIDASAIGTAYKDAITQAQGQLVTETGTLATTISDALDARLKAQTLPATREIAALQAQITASQQAHTAGDAAQAVTDAQKKLNDLQTIYGSGALTSDQAQQVAQARLALSDALAAQGNDAKQARITQLQAGVDSATKASDAAKAAASKRLSDLSAELNDGLISQATYVKRLNALLAKEGVNYKTTGKLLGQSLADGFRDGLASILAQAKVLGGLGQGTLAGASRGTKAINPAKAEADAIKTFLDSAAQSGGKFTVTGAGNLPPGVTLASLLAQAGSQRAESSYQVKQGAKTDKGLAYAGQTRDHTAQMVKELQKLNAKPAVVVVTDTSKAKRKTAAAVQR